MITMLLRHFNLREQPFGMTPDPRYLYASYTHREGLASLLYAIESGAAFVTLIAQPGMGKTTLLFECLQRLGKSMRTVFLCQAISDPMELLRAILLDLEVDEVGGSQTELQAKLNAVLKEEASKGKRLLVIIDEAHNLDEATLEAVRMLSNFETARHKLIQIVLAGQLELAEKLASPQLLQFRQRVSTCAYLKALSISETSLYIQHRLALAGLEDGQILFTKEALAAIAKYSHGIPRNINNLCFNALSLAFAQSQTKVDVGVIHEVVADLDITLESAKERLVADTSEEPVVVAPEPEPEKKRFRSGYGLGLLFLQAAACAVVIVWGGLSVYNVYAQNAAHTRPVAVHAVASHAVAPNAVALSPVTVVASSSSSPTPPTPDDITVVKPGMRLLKVREGQSLTRICTETFGFCSSKLLKSILEANASIRDPNHIESGYRLKIPDIAADSRSGTDAPVIGGSAQKETSAHE